MHPRNVDNGEVGLNSAVHFKFSVYVKVYSGEQEVIPLVNNGFLISGFDSAVYFPCCFSPTGGCSASSLSNTLFEIFFHCFMLAVHKSLAGVFWRFFAGQVQKQVLLFLNTLI